MTPAREDSAYGQAMLNAMATTRWPKLSSDEPAQFLNSWPLRNSRYCYESKAVCQTKQSFFK